MPLWIFHEFSVKFFREESGGSCSPISPRKRRMQRLSSCLAPTATPSKPWVERLLEQSNDLEDNPGPLPQRLVPAHSGAQALLDKKRGRSNSMKHEMDQGCKLARPHLPRLLEQANDIESNPGPLPHRLVSRAPTSAAQQPRGKVTLSTWLP